MDVGDNFMVPKYIPYSETGLKNLKLRPSLNFAFTGRDLFGVTITEYLEIRNNKDIRSRNLARKD